MYPGDCFSNPLSHVFTESSLYYGNSFQYEPSPSDNLGFMQS